MPVERADVRGRAIRWVIFLGLAAFAPLFYFLAVVGGFLPYGGILLITLRNLKDGSLVAFGLVHLAIYGALLLSLTGLIARLIERRASDRAWLATLGVFALLAGIGAMPIFGIAHGQIRWENAYQLYASKHLR